MNSICKGIIFLIIFVVCSITSPSLLFADPVSSVGIASYLQMNGDKIQDGDIVIATAQGYFVSEISYDPRMIGVITTKPAVELRALEGGNKGYPVVSRGTAFVKVSNVNGAIKKGDFITTSSVKGAGMKATKSGYVLGEALEGAAFPAGTNVTMIPMTLNLRFIQFGSNSPDSLSDIFSLTQVATYEEPIRVIQYIIAAIIVISSFGFGFLIFARAVNTGIQALGRNPLAGRMIQLSIVFNLLLIIIIIVTGVSLAYLVIRMT